MPFTPFHVGPSLLLKTAIDKRISVTAFAISQIVMDIEPLIRMFRGDAILHGMTHTYLATVPLALIAYLITRLFLKFFVYRFNASTQQMKFHWLSLSVSTKRCVLFSALLGTISHVFLDSIMHFDIRPYAPFSNANQLYSLISIDDLYSICFWSGVTGLVLWLIRKKISYAAVEMRSDS